MASSTYYQSAGRILNEQIKNADCFERSVALAQVCGNLAVVDAVNALRTDIAGLHEAVSGLVDAAGQNAAAMADIKNVLAEIGMRFAS